MTVLLFTHLFKGSTRNVFGNVYREYSTKVGCGRLELEKIGKELGIQSLEGWYSVSPVLFKRKMRLLNKHFNETLYDTLNEHFPHHKWNPLLLSKQKQTLIHDEVLQRDALDVVGRKLGVNKLDDWYSISQTVIKRKLPFIDYHYNGSLLQTLKKLYPQHNWDPLCFLKLPQGYWSDLNHQRNALKRVGAQLGVKQLDDWYNISYKHIKPLCFISDYYHGATYEMLKTLYPNHNWDPLRFIKAPRGYWKDEVHQREALERIGREELGVKQLDDWYSVSREDVKHKLSFIRNYYDNSLEKMLRQLYPHHKWKSHLFHRAPHGFWLKPDTKEKFKKLMHRWEHKYNITQLKDWYQLPPHKSKLFRKAVQGIFDGSTAKMLKEWFPNSQWSSLVQSSAPEHNLVKMLQRLVDIQCHSKIGRHSLDIYIPKWKLAIEYQGEQHFHQTWRGSLTTQVKRDQEKELYCQEADISLVTVNHHWNGSWSQLRATIRQSRPGRCCLIPSF